MWTINFECGILVLVTETGPTAVVDLSSLENFCCEYWVSEPKIECILMILIKKYSASGNRTPVSRVTGGDTHHYTNEDWLNTVSAHMRAKSGEFYHFLPCGTCFCTTDVVISAFSCHATNIGSIFAWEKTVVVCHCNCVQEKAVAMFWCNMKPESIVEMQRNSQGYKLVLLKPPYGGFEVTQVWHTAPRCYGTHYPLKPSSVPGWARTTNLSVNSRTR